MGQSLGLHGFQSRSRQSSQPMVLDDHIQWSRDPSLPRGTHYSGAVPLADSVMKGLCAVALMEVEHLVKAEFVKGQKGLSVFVHALREVEHLKP